MMATMILVVGFMGTIQAITIGSGMLATARRQTLANQIITHEIEKLRLKSWDEFAALTNSAAEPYASDSPALARALAASGVTFTVARGIESLTSDLREVTFTVEWVAGGSATSPESDARSWLDRLASAPSSPASRTHVRRMSAYFGRNGLALAAQR